MTFSFSITRLPECLVTRTTRARKERQHVTSAPLPESGIGHAIVFIVVRTWSASPKNRTWADIDPLPAARRNPRCRDDTQRRIGGKCKQSGRITFIVNPNDHAKVEKQNNQTKEDSRTQQNVRRCLEKSFIYGILETTPHLFQNVKRLRAEG